MARGVRQAGISCGEASMDEYIPKPIEEEQIRQFIGRLKFDAEILAKKYIKTVVEKVSSSSIEPLLEMMILRKSVMVYFILNNTPISVTYINPFA